MASAFSHAIAAIGLGKVFKPDHAGSKKGIDWKFWLAGAFCAVIPDADAIGFKLGVPYDSLWGHRGITHSLFFALLLAIVVMLLLYRTYKPSEPKWWLYLLFFFVCTASHPVLDAMTTGGLGVAFFAPFNNTRYFFPFRPIAVSPIGVTQFFSTWGLRVIKSELLWVWLPSGVLFTIAAVIRRLLRP